MINANELLKQRYKVYDDYPQTPFQIGDIFHVNDDEEYISQSISIQPSKYPHLFKKLGWWEDRKIEDMPIYLKRTGMVDDNDNPLPERYLKVKQHFNYGHGEWRDNSVHIFCIAPSERTYGTGLFYSEFEPCTEEEYFKNKAINHDNK